MLFNKRKIGDGGEARAVKYLKKKKYEIIARNVHTKYGEIDIIAKKEGTYIFIEVKLRSNDAFGKGFEAVDHKKQGKIRSSALFYCSKNAIEALCRFDVISIDGDEITHIENAF